MALILLLETSTASCSVALMSEGQLIAVKEVNERNAHASMLTIFIQELMALGGRQMSELDAVAVSMGPGSYTGLRIGVSAAKGLCFALDIPLIAINTMEAMARGYVEQRELSDVYLCPMIDARRMEVYAAVFDAGLNEVRSTEAVIVDSESFSELLESGSVHFFGDGAMKCKEVLGHKQNAVFAEGFLNSARYLMQAAQQKFKEGVFEDVAYFEPFYLKDFLVTQPKKLV